MRLRLACVLGLVLTSAGLASAQDARRDDPEPAPAPKAPVVTKAPEIVKQVEPEYPAEALAAGLAASVEMVITISATGAVTDVRVVKPAGNGFDEAAVAAVQQYTFTPAEIDGKPAAIRIAYTLHFALPKPVPEPVPEPVPDPEPDWLGDPAPTPTGPTGIVEGTVKEKGTREVIETAEIRIGDITVFTDVNGKFSVAVPIGKWQVTAGDPAHTSDQVEVDVTTAEAVDVTFWLRPLRVNPYETVVRGKREETVVARRTLEREQLRTVPGTFGDPLRVLESLPGVARAPFGAGVLILRGAGPRDSGVFVDGVQIPLLFHFLGGPSVFNAEFIERLDLYPGGFPIRYGRLQGGVVDVTLRKPALKKKTHGAFNFNLIDSSAFVDVPLTEKARIAIGARRSYLDLVLAVALPSDTLTVAPVYYDYQTRFDWAPSRNDSLAVMFFGADDFLTLVQNEAGEEQGADIDINSHIGFHRLAANWRHRLSKNVTLSLAPSLGYDIISFAAGPTASGDVGAYQWDLREEVEIKSWPTLGLRFGLDIQSRFTVLNALVPVPADFRTFDEVDVDETRVERLIDFYGAGIWSEAVWDATPRLRLVPGLRTDLYTYVGQLRASVDPRLNAQFQATRKLALKAGAGLYTQPPPPEVLDRTLGQPNLDQSYTAQFSGGFLRNFSRVLSLDMQGYFIQRWDQIQGSQTTSINDDGELVVQRLGNNTVGRTFGAEVLLRREVTSNFFGWVSYTLSYTERKRPQDPDYIPYFFDQTHNLVGVASYMTDSGWEMGVRFQYTSGRPKTRITGSTFHSDEDRYFATREQLNTERQDAYLSIDARIEKTWTWDTWKLSAFLDVRNVTNNENAEFEQYDYRFRERAPVRGVPILPSFGLRGQF